MKSLWSVRLASVMAFFLTAGVALCQSADQLMLPPRPAAASTGSQFKDQILNLARDVREEAIYHEITSGNVPDFIRNLKPVTISGTVGSQPHTVTFYVTPEYMSVGSDADYFRLPMSAPLAQWVADAAQCSLPTKKMVNAIWAAATVKLTPSPIPPSAEMITVPVFWDHELTIRDQRSSDPAPLGALVEGHKKNVVISPRIYQYPSPARVLIYGWTYPNGTIIQNLTGVHESTYADYSHGIRLVSNSCLLDGTSVSLQSILNSPTLETLLNDDTDLNNTAVHITYTVNAPPRYPAGAPPTGPGAFPYADSFPSTGRQLSQWINRFTVPAIQAFSPVSPSGDGYVLVVRDPSGGIDTTRLGASTDADYAVQCDIYCDYRPELAGDGFERVGIFARDDGNGLFCGKNGAGTILGNNYSMTWDSNNGRLQCLRTVNGIPTDLLPAPLYYASSQWRQMRIDTVGSQITFKLDGAPVLSVTDTSRQQGQFGIGYQEQFTTNTNIRGTIADNFLAVAIESSKVQDWSLY
jgi:hypothetical protein